MNRNSAVQIRRLTWSALCLALCLVLPFLTGQIPQIGSMLSPMHFPVLICGFLCGWPWGLAVGLIAPVLRSLIFGMPPMFPNAVAMSLELCTYGFVSGLLHKLLPKKNAYLYLELILAMIAGRIVWGLAEIVLLGLSGSAFTMKAFLAGAITNAIPGIILQIVIVPILVIAVKKITPEK